jgi:hypothetical protein
MPVLELSNLATTDVLGFGVLVLMVLMMGCLAVWFACSTVESILKMRRQLRRSNYDVLLRENERLKDSLADAREENDYLRRLYRPHPFRASAKEQNVA